MRQFPNTPTFHPAAAALPASAHHPASPHSATGRRRARRTGPDRDRARAWGAVPDRDLLAAVATGDDATGNHDTAAASDALAELLHRHRRELWALAYRYVRRDHVAHDVLATVLEHIWCHAAQFDGRAAVGTWLHRITVNAAIDVLRRERARAHDAPAAVAATDEDLSLRALTDAHARHSDLTGDVAAASVDRDFVARLLAELPAAQRRAVEVVDLAGHSITDAAALLGCPEGTVKSRRARAFRTLAARWTLNGDRRRP